MKRLLFIGVLALAVGGWLHAQGTLPEGMSLTGQVRTGVGVNFGNSYSQWGGDYDPMLTVGYDDGMGAYWTRTQLNFILNRGNYGFTIAPRFQWNNSDGTMPFSARVMNAFGWFNLMDGMMRITAGYIDENRWMSPCAGEWRYSRGLGVRFELSPIEELNVGVFIRPSHRWNTQDSQDVANAFLNTSFGISFDAGIVDVAAGLELAGDGELRRADEGRWGAMGRNGPVIDLDGDDSVAVSAYVGLALHVIEDLGLAFGVHVANIDDLNNHGNIHINQDISFDLSPIRVGIEMHQLFWNIGDGVPVAGNNDMTTQLEFLPWAGFDISDTTRVGAEIPLNFRFHDGDMEWLEIGFVPYVRHQLGAGMYLGGRYRLMVRSYNDGPNRVDNQVAAFFGWTF